jgi:hypothetical protein
MSQRVHINPQSISTEYFDRAGENSLEQFTNLNRCKFFPDGSAAEDAARLIDTKWVQVTPFGVSESRKMNYIDGQLVPQQANSADYRNPWLE